MAQPDRNSQKEKPPRGNEPSFNWRGVILIAIAFALIGLAVLFRGGAYANFEEIPYPRFLELLENKQIVNDKNFPLQLVYQEGQPTQTLRGAYIKQAIGPNGAQQVPFRTVVALNYATNLQDKLSKAGIEPAIRTDSNLMAQTLVGFLPIALFLLVLYFLFRQQIRMAGKGALNFGKSKARMLARDKNKITFKGVAGGHDEREQTLNALLVEMDGFDTQEGVIIIAATNRPDVLDPALLRPGRFDRQITVNLPDVKGREEILRVHSKKVKLAEGVDLAVVARGTPGYSGAELANVINEAALLAARRGLKGITLKELEEARDKVRWGKERRSLALSEKEKTNTAYHEAGHALLLELLPHTEPLHKVTIIPRGPSLGSTMWLPEEDKYTNRKNELLASLAVKMGGRVAEEIVFGDVTTGAAGDIKMATAMA